MDGSQLLTDRTHLIVKSASGGSDSKMRDVSQKHSATASKKGPMTKNEDVTKMSKMPEMSKTSKKVTVAESSESGTNE